MEDITMFVYYDWEKPHSVIRPEKPFTKEMELIRMLARGNIVGFDVELIERVYEKEFDL